MPPRHLCLHCDARFETQDRIVAHIAREHRVDCRYCPRSFQTEVAADNHLWDVHECSVCEFAGTLAERQNHIKTVHRELLLAKLTAPKRKIVAPPTSPEKNAKKKKVLQTVSTIQNQLTAVVDDVAKLKENHQALTDRVAFLEAVKEAKSAEKNAEFGDKKKANILRLYNFDWEKQDILDELKMPTLQQKIILAGTQIIRSLFPELPFSIVKGNLYHRNGKLKKDVIELTFLEPETDVPDLFLRLALHCRTVAKRFVERLISPSTRIRYLILSRVGVRLDELAGGLAWRVKYEGVKPFLHLSQGDKEERYDFGDSLTEFRHLLNAEDSEKIKKACTDYGIVGNYLKQFLIKL